MSKVYDVIIVGAGPGGVAAAVRAQEKGLDYLVIEKGSEVFKGLKERYPSEKTVYPTVPKGMDGKFKVDFLKPPEEKVYLEEYIEQVKEGLKHLEAKNFNFKEKFRGFKKRDGRLEVETSEDRYQTRNLILAIGSGVPRELKLYGEAAPIAHTLENPEDYIGEHVLVIGGGNSGAGVVRNLSRVKREAGDPTHIYWAHRRERFKVNREVARDLGEEILLGGKIIILQETMPTVGMRDKRGTLMLNMKVSEYLTAEGVRMYQGMSFPMSDVIACIGYESPTLVLESFGLRTMDKDGLPKEDRKGEPRVVLNENLETSVGGIYAVGGAISPAFMREKKGELREVTHPDLIYTAVNDAAMVIEDIAGKLEG